MASDGIVSSAARVIRQLWAHSALEVCLAVTSHVTCSDACALGWYWWQLGGLRCGP
jgi:hypothetical protein